MTTARRGPIPPSWRAVVSLCLTALGCAGVLTVGSWTSSVAPATALSCGTAPSCGGAGNTGSGVDLWRGITRPGDGGGSGSGGSGASSGQTPRPSCTPQAIPPPSCIRDPISAVPGPTDPGRPSLSLFDLRHVVPQTPGLATEPAGWSVVNLPTNIVGFASSHLRHATVLGYDVDVMFIPVSYFWTYGDGHTLAGGTPGDTWEHLGVGEFGPTPTAHVYRSPGRFTVSLIVGYVAQYRYSGESWRAVDGLVSAASHPVSLVLGSFDRALVGLR